MADPKRAFYAVFLLFLLVSGCAPVSGFFLEQGGAAQASPVVLKEAQPTTDGVFLTANPEQQIPDEEGLAFKAYVPLVLNQLPDPRLSLLGLVPIGEFEFDITNLPVFSANAVDREIVLGTGTEVDGASVAVHSAPVGISGIPEGNIQDVIYTPCGPDGKYKHTGYSFAWVPNMGWQSSGYHPGEDGTCSDGKVRAMFSGIVWKVYPDLKLSNQASIDYWCSGRTYIIAKNVAGTTYFQVACHMKYKDEGYPKAGDFVEAGDVLGIVGSTGKSTGPHIHSQFGFLTQAGFYWMNPIQVWKAGSFARLNIAPFANSSVVSTGGVKSDAPTISNNASCSGRSVLENVSLAKEIAGSDWPILGALWLQESHFVDSRLSDDGSCKVIQNSIGATCMGQVLLSAHPDVSKEDLSDPEKCLKVSRRIFRSRPESTDISKAAGYQGFCRSGYSCDRDPTFVRTTLNWYNIGGFNVLMEDGSTVWISFRE